MINMEPPRKGQNDGDSIKQLYGFCNTLLEEIQFLTTNLGYNNLKLNGIKANGIDSRLLQAINLAANTSFEVFNSDGIPKYWSGGESTADAKHSGSYSMKLAPNNSSQQTGWVINPFWYKLTNMRVTFEKKHGRCLVQVLDLSNNNTPLELVDEAGNKAGKQIVFNWNENWDINSRCTFTVLPQKSSNITVKFTNLDDTWATYIDDVHVHPDITGMPVIYRDGPRSSGYKGTETKAIHVGPNPPDNPDIYDLWIET